MDMVRTWISRHITGPSITSFGVAIVLLALPFTGVVNPENAWWFVGVGVCLIGLGIYFTIRNELKNIYLDKVKDDLIEIQAIQKRVANELQIKKPTDKSVRPLRGDLTSVFAPKALDPFIPLIGNTEKTKVGIAPFISIYELFGNILDKNNYGFKEALLSDKEYRLCEVKLSQDLLKVKLSKKKYGRVRQNIEIARKVMYGLNSVIVLRRVSKILYAPFINSLKDKENETDFVNESLIGLEGVEQQGDKVLNKMLSELDKEWKATVEPWPVNTANPTA